MPKRTLYKKKSRRAMRGRGALWDYLSKAHSFIKKHKLISTAAKAYSTTPYSYASEIGKIGNLAAQMGYGRKKRVRMVGSSLKPAGGALMPTGSGYKRGGRYTYGRR